MKILIVGDSPFIRTGFGRVNSIAAKAFQNAGHTVGAVSGLSMDVVSDDQGIQMFYPQQGDVLGVMRAAEAMSEFDPDLVYHTGEPGTLTAFSKVVPARLPFVGYVPIEGEPIVNEDWKSVLSGVHLVTCSEYGSKVVEKYCGFKPDWVYHGVDHESFKVNGRRDEVRKMFGWDDKFVIMTVASNVRRKQHPRLFEALSILKHHYKQNDIILYDHTIPFDGYWLEGWHLPEIARAFRVEQEVVFNPALAMPGGSVPDVGLYDGIGLVDLYNAADLFVLPSQVEGFGLPIAEAMACGVPVMVTKYAAGWEVASPAGIPIPVKDWEIHKSGTRYANADVEALASEILRVKRDTRGRSRRRDLGLQRVRDFHWEAYTEKIVGHVEKAAQEKALSLSQRSQEKEPQDQGQNESATSQGTDSRDEN